MFWYYNVDLPGYSGLPESVRRCPRQAAACRPSPSAGTLAGSPPFVASLSARGRPCPGLKGDSQPRETPADHDRLAAPASLPCLSSKPGPGCLGAGRPKRRLPLPEDGSRSRGPRQLRLAATTPVTKPWVKDTPASRVRRERYNFCNSLRARVVKATTLTIRADPAFNQPGLERAGNPGPILDLPVLRARETEYRHILHLLSLCAPTRAQAARNPSFLQLPATRFLHARQNNPRGTN